jgi:hypothetical protein
MKPTRPTVSRDTRVLLMIVVISTAILWTLARLRFPGREPTPNPVTPVLAQLAPPSAFDDITAAVTQVAQRVRPLIVMVDVDRSDGPGVPLTRTLHAALRFRDNLAVTLLNGARAGRAHAAIAGGNEVARDRASHVAVVRLPGNAFANPIRTARALSYPRFLIAADPGSGGMSLRPVFVGSLHPVDTPVWAEPLWALPRGIDVSGGTFLFSTDGAWVGLVVERDGAMALVPANAVLAMAEALVQEGATRPGWLGIEVAPLTAEVAAAAGSTAGVAITWIDPRSPAAGQLRPGDILERLGETPAGTLDDWEVLAARISEGESVELGVRRAGQPFNVPLAAGPPPEEPVERPLGLTLRTISGTGVEVVRVAPASAAAAAGLQAGDLITLIGDVERPTAPQATRAFNALAAQQPIILAITRGGDHHVTALERTW